MKRVRLPVALLPLLLAIACTQQGGELSSPTVPSGSLSAVPSANSSALSATVRFGLDTLGSPFPPPSGHDQSGHARDSLVPRTVVIDKGGMVTFELPAGSVHQVAVYDDGTTPEDINTSALSFGGCFGVPLIADTNARLFTPPPQPCAGGPTSVARTFTKPGRYLVICTFLPHFEEGMYGWVIVRDR
jgi:plastocyanin